MELFLERGYDTVTVAEIAARAGLTKRTFFRHFTDKREVLFSGHQPAHGRFFAEAIVGAPVGATPLAAIGAGLQAISADFSEDRRDFLAQRQTVIASNPDLRERELLKRAALTATMAGALSERGVTEPNASLAAEVGALALSAAYSRWLEPANAEPIARLVDGALRELSAAARALK